MVIIVSLHLLLAVGFMLYFFHVPGDVSQGSSNITVVDRPSESPGANNTKLSVAASVESKTEEKRDEPKSEDKDNVLDTGGDQQDAKEKPVEEQPEENSETDKNTQKEENDESAAALNLDPEVKPEPIKEAEEVKPKKDD